MTNATTVIDPMQLNHNKPHSGNGNHNAVKVNSFNPEVVFRREEEEIMAEHDEEVRSVDSDGNDVVDPKKIENRMLTVALVKSVVETSSPSATSQEAPKDKREPPELTTTEAEKDSNSSQQQRTYSLRKRSRPAGGYSPRSPRKTRSSPCGNDSSSPTSPANSEGRKLRTTRSSTQSAAENQVKNIEGNNNNNSNNNNNNQPKVTAAGDGGGDCADSIVKSEASNSGGGAGSGSSSNRNTTTASRSSLRIRVKQEDSQSSHCSDKTTVNNPLTGVSTPTASNARGRPAAAATNTTTTAQPKRTTTAQPSQVIVKKEEDSSSTPDLLSTTSPVPTIRSKDTTNIKVENPLNNPTQSSVSTTATNTSLSPSLPPPVACPLPPPPQQPSTIVSSTVPPIPQTTTLSTTAAGGPLAPAPSAHVANPLPAPMPPPTMTTTQQQQIPQPLATSSSQQPQHQQQQQPTEQPQPYDTKRERSISELSTGSLSYALTGNASLKRGRIFSIDIDPAGLDFPDLGIVDAINHQQPTSAAPLPPINETVSGGGSSGPVAIPTGVQSSAPVPLQQAQPPAPLSQQQQSQQPQVVYQISSTSTQPTGTQSLRHPSAPTYQNSAIPVAGASDVDPMLINVAGRDRAMSFEFFSFGINADEPLPPVSAPEQASSSTNHQQQHSSAYNVITGTTNDVSADSSNANRPRGDSIIFDPVSFRDGGILEENYRLRSRGNSLDVGLSNDEMAIMNTPGFMPATSRASRQEKDRQTNKHLPHQSAPLAAPPSVTANGTQSYILPSQSTGATPPAVLSASALAATNKPPPHHQQHTATAVTPATGAPVNASTSAIQMATLPSSLGGGASISHATFQMELLNKDGRIGIYLPEARKARIAKFHSKRKMRIWRKRIKYDCRKKLADSRPRIKGRFVKRSDMDD